MRDKNDINSEVSKLINKRNNTLIRLLFFASLACFIVMFFIGMIDETTATTKSTKEFWSTCLLSLYILYIFSVTFYTFKFFKLEKSKLLNDTDSIYLSNNDPS